MDPYVPWRPRNEVAEEPAAETVEKTKPAEGWWPKLRWAIVEALDPYPEAREAVIAAIKGMEGPDGG